MRQQDDTDQRILEIAREQFLRAGVEHTEMKDIAARLGSSRSTLYRHFPSKDAILFSLAQQALDAINRDAAAAVPGSADDSGCAEFAAQLHALNDSLLRHPEDVRFLRDFDYLFTGSYPDSMRESFTHYFARSDTETPLLASYRRGIADGSIRPSADPVCDVETICNACIALAQRILPRRAHYLDEHGYADALLTRQADLLLAGIRTAP